MAEFFAAVGGIIIVVGVIWALLWCWKLQGESDEH